MAIYLSRKKGGTVATPITPSNSSPAALTANSAVTPTANGYAIESYSSVTPSNSSPVTLTSGDIVKLGGNGKAVASVADVTPSMYPTEVLYNNIYKMNGSGYVVDYDPTPSTITPSNSNPAYFVIGEILSPTSSGYAIQSYSSKTPSDSSPASVSSGAIIKASASGYLYSSSGLKNFKVGTFTMPSTGNTVSVTCGFQPKYIAYFRTGSSGTAIIYDENYSTTNTVRCTSSGISDGTIGNQNYGLNAITSTGFSVRGGSSTGTYYYFAVG